jgi:hypothetical protein
VRVYKVMMMIRTSIFSAYFKIGEVDANTSRELCLRAPDVQTAHAPQTADLPRLTYLGQHGEKCTFRSGTADDLSFLFLVTQVYIKLSWFGSGS